MKVIFFQGAVLASVLSMASAALAREESYPMSVNTMTSGEGSIAAPATGMVTRSGRNVVVRIINSCYGTNLRGITNPLAPSSIITANINLRIGATAYTFTADYPADLVTRTGMVTAGSIGPNTTVSTNPAGAATGAMYGNMMIFSTNIRSTISISAGGVVTESDPLPVVMESTSTFAQTVTNCSGGAYGKYGHSAHTPTAACGTFMGTNGPLTAAIGGLVVSADKTTIDIPVSFPGQTGFCGGWWSPLMVFFDQQRPQFENTSNFPLNPFGRTAWPEKNHAGYFVAMDHDGSGKIDQKDELFGDSGKQTNGFEVLKKYDSNHDKMIDRRDKDFKKLVLWQDKNGDGISQPEEMVKLSSKVTKISLKYNDNLIRPISEFAEERQRSHFWYKNAKGKSKRGDIIDIWLAPIPHQQLSQK